MIGMDAVLARPHNALGLRNIHQRKQDGLYTVDIRIHKKGEMVVRRVKSFSDLALAVIWRNEQRKELGLPKVLDGFNLPL